MDELNERIMSDIPTNFRVIALAGAYGAGKSTCAKLIKQCLDADKRVSFTEVMSFAEPLKASLQALGFSYVELYKHKNVRNKVHGLTGREAMNRMGPALRAALGNDLFVKLAVHHMHTKAELLAPKLVVFVIDDLRYPVELNTLRQMQSLCIHIDRPGATGHPADSKLPPELDVVIHNTGTPQDLAQQGAKAVDQLLTTQWSSMMPTGAAFAQHRRRQNDQSQAVSQLPRPCPPPPLHEHPRFAGSSVHRALRRTYSGNFALPEAYRSIASGLQVDAQAVPEKTRLSAPPSIPEPLDPRDEPNAETDKFPRRSER